MKVILTGANGSVGKKYTSMFPGVIPVDVNYRNNDSLHNLTKEMQDADVIIHAAANNHPRYLSYALTDNTMLPIRIAEIASKINSGIHLILLSSMSILDEFGDPKKIKDMTLLGSSKYLMEEFAKKCHNVPITIVRFSTLFFEDNEKDGLSQIIYTAKKYGKVVAADCKRDFLPLDIACMWINKLCGNHAWYNKTINLASGSSINMLDVARFLVKKYGVSFHHTSLPVFDHICYRFDSNPAQTLMPIKFSIYDRIVQYYNSIEM